MTTRKRDHSRIVTVRGKAERVIESVRIGGRTYDLLERLSQREAYRVFDAQAGPHGDYRMLHRLPKGNSIGQRLAVLQRLAGPNSNPNFPTTTQCVREGREWCVVTTWIDGVSLRDFLRSVRGGEIARPSTPEVVRLCRGLAHGLGHYHRRLKLIHGDVTPANLILTKAPSRLVLVDFGSAWPVERSASKEPGDGLSKAYAAPERIGHHTVEDFRCDAFSLAVIAYELLTLEIPYDGVGGAAGVPGRARDFADTLVPATDRIATAKRALPRRAIEQLETCLSRGLSLDPDARFVSRKQWLDSWDRTHQLFQRGPANHGFLHRLAAGITERIAAIRRR